MPEADPVVFVPWSSGPFTISGTVTIGGQPIAVTATIDGQPILVALENIDQMVDLLRRILATLELATGIHDAAAQSGGV